jgi:hypothetical protein
LLCSFLHPPITPSFFSPNILLSTLFSNTLSHITHSQALKLNFDSDLKNWVTIKATLQPTVSWPVCPGVSPSSGICDLPFIKIIFIQLHVSYYGASSLMGGWVCNYSCCWDLPQVRLPSSLPSESQMSRQCSILNIS